MQNEVEYTYTCFSVFSTASLSRHCGKPSLRIGFLALYSVGVWRWREALEDFCGEGTVLGSLDSTIAKGGLSTHQWVEFALRRARSASPAEREERTS